MSGKTPIRKLNYKMRGWETILFLFGTGFVLAAVHSLKLVSMYDPLFNPSRGIRNKADAMQFAINATMKHNGCHESSGIDYDEAEKLFNFICEHVEFPEESTKQVFGQILPILEEIFGGNPYDLTSQLSKLKVENCSE